jgi:hypothetical protein
VTAGRAYISDVEKVLVGAGKILVPAAFLA